MKRLLITLFLLLSVGLIACGGTVDIEPLAQPMAEAIELVAIDETVVEVNPNEEGEALVEVEVYESNPSLPTPVAVTPTMIPTPVSCGNWPAGACVQGAILGFKAG